MTISTCSIARSGATQPSESEFFQCILPKVREYAAWRFRRLPPHEHEEACANADALAWQKYQSLVLRGKKPVEFATRLARIVVCHVCAGRQVGNSANCQDVLSRAARIKHGISVERIGMKTYDQRQGWRELVVEDHRSGPAQIAATRLDFEAWLSRLTPRRRLIAESLAQGNLPMDVAKEFRLSRGRVSQLRRAFEDSWQDFQRDVSEFVIPSSAAAA
jgi:hypothetical protein